jgi:peptidoglycan hydrolase-like protein with peptidoglycan-binding domain
MSDTYYTGDVEVVPEETGAHIEELQNRLRDGGYLNVPADGRFGPETQEALAAFGNDHGANDGSYITILRAVEDQTGPLQSAEWVQRFTVADAAYGHEANIDGRFLGENLAGNDVWQGKARDQTYYPSDNGEDPGQFGYEMDQDGNFFRSGADGTLEYLDTTGITTKAGMAGSKSERMIYTMDGEGDFRLADPRAEEQARPGERFHHSSLGDGQAVAGAGEMKLRDGQVEAVSDRSGHYAPDFAMTQQVGEALEDGGVDVSKVTFELGNYPDNQRDTLVTGSELLAYDRDAILADLRVRLWADAQAQAAGLPPGDQEAEATKVYDALYSPFEAMDERTLRAEARKIIEGRHDAQRTVLADIAGAQGWREDPTKRFEWRWFDGQAWTERVSVQDVQSTDADGALLANQVSVAAAQAASQPAIDGGYST